MKTTQKDFAGAAARAVKDAGLFFFCGPDEAGASAAAARIHELLPDPGERVELIGSGPAQGSRPVKRRSALLLAVRG